jgi:structural maintenance of chromosome 3 (chondroitin sulfate proteoglycan 6)
MIRINTYEGRVTFMPLNRLNPTVPTIPKSTSFIPLISKLKFDEKFRKVFEQIFGRTVLAQDLESGAQFARENNVNSVTIDGDQVNRRGALTGGHIDKRQSRLKLVREIGKATKDHKQQKDTRDKKQQILDTTEREITQIVGELHKLEEQIHNEHTTITRENMELRMLATQEANLKETITQMVKTFN